METSYREHNSFLPRTKSKNYIVRLLYYAVAVCIYNAWCILNAHDRKGTKVIAPEAKVSLILTFLIPSNLTIQPATENHG